MHHSLYDGFLNRTS